jgi:heme-degrading monooxygenase HmoA
MASPSGQFARRSGRTFIGGLVALCGAAAGMLGLSGCRMATAFRGDGYAPGAGVRLAGVGETVTVGITNAVLDNSKRGPFDDFTRQTVESLPGTPGYIGHSVRTVILGNEVWTMTVWRDEQALDAFVESPVHQQAIRQGLAAVTSARFLRFEWPTRSVPPSWDEVLERLKNAEVIDYTKRRGDRQ